MDLKKCILFSSLVLDHHKYVLIILYYLCINNKHESMEPKDNLSNKLNIIKLLVFIKLKLQ